MARVAQRRKQRVDQNLARLQASLDEAQGRYDAEVGRKRSAYKAEFASYEQAVAAQQREFDAQQQAYNARVSEYQAAQQANAAQRQSMLEAYQRDVESYNVRRGDYEAEVLRIMEPYQAQLQAQQAAYANQMEDYNRSFAQYQQQLRNFDAYEKGYLRDLQAQPVVFTGIQEEDGSLRSGRLRAYSDLMYVSDSLQYQIQRPRGAFVLDVTVNDAVQFVPTSREYVPPRQGRGGTTVGFYNVEGYLRQRLPDGTFVDQGPEAYTQTERPTFSATAPTRPALINAPTLPDAPTAPTAPTLPLFTMESPSAPARLPEIAPPAQPDFTAEDAALQAEIARETEYYDREIAERRAGRRRARATGGRRPVISQEQVAAAQQPSLSEGQSLGQAGFLGGT